MDKYGNVTVDGKEYSFTQDAYPAGGSFDTGNGRYDGNWYEAHAKDADGNEYMIRWTRVDWETEDSGNACDWDNPDEINLIELSDIAEERIRTANAAEVAALTEMANAAIAALPAPKSGAYRTEVTPSIDGVFVRIALFDEGQIWHRGFGAGVTLRADAPRESNTVNLREYIVLQTSR